MTEPTCTVTCKDVYGVTAEEIMARHPQKEVVGLLWEKPDGNDWQFFPTAYPQFDKLWNPPEWNFGPRLVVRDRKPRRITLEQVLPLPARVEAGEYYGYANGGVGLTFCFSAGTTMSITEVWRVVPEKER